MLSRLYVCLVYFFARPVLEHHQRATAKSRRLEIDETVMHSAMRGGLVAHGVRDVLMKDIRENGPTARAIKGM